MLFRNRFRKISFVITPIGFVVIFFFQNCGKPSDLQYQNQTAAQQLADQTNALQILQSNCASCHNPSNPQGGVTDITNVSFLLYSRIVVAGEPGISLMMSEINQGLMPPSPNPGLSGAEVQALETWITGLTDNGAGYVPGPTPAPIQPTYSSIASQVFTPICISCHQSNMYTLNSYSAVMEVVTPGNSANSILYQAITTGLSGGVMPQGSSLGPDQIAAIKTWIDDGAPNN